jgi:pimeloyl-ACP methyl ester carboxylesterase
MTTGITAPTLQIHGALDPCVLPTTAEGSRRYVRGEYDWQLIDGVGHFPHEEAPDLVTKELLRWCGSA